MRWGSMDNERFGFGICRLSVVPVRATPTHKAEQVNQLLFGDHYAVLQHNEDQSWLLIRTHFDQYEGWIDRKQHTSISEEYFDYLNTADFKITTDITAQLLYNKNPLMILQGSIIPITGSELFKMEDQFAFNGESKTLGQKRDAEFIKSTALKYLHAPYQLGGKTPYGIDCSGFTQMVFKISGYALPRDAWQQAKCGKSIVFDARRSCDVVFFSNDEGRIVHVGILLSESKIIHASGQVRIDDFSHEGIIHRDTQKLTHRVSHLQRILAD